MGNLNNMFKQYEELEKKTLKKDNNSIKNNENVDNVIDIIISDIEELSRFNIEFNNKKVKIYDNDYSFYLLKLIFDRYNTDRIKEFFNNDFSFRFISNINGDICILCPLVNCIIFEKLIEKQDEIYNTNLKEKYNKSKRR